MSIVARKIFSASFVVVLLLAIILPISTVKASTTVVWVSCMHFGAAATLGDSIPANAILDGVHVWELWMQNDISSSALVVDPHITVTSPIDSSHLSFRPKPSSILTSGPNTVYDWSFPSISPDGTYYVDGGGYPRCTYSPMFDCSRTVSPFVISSRSKLQNLAVRVTPHFAADWVWAWVALTRSRVETATFVSATPSFNDSGTWSDGTPWAQWKLKSYPEKEYVLKCTIQVTNKAYPGTIHYKPRVTVGCWGVVPSSSLFVTGSSITAQDETLGSIRYSASGTYQWIYQPQKGTLVDYRSVYGYGTP